MTSKFTREELLNIIETDHVQCGEASALARMALAAMDRSESVELPLDYLHGHKDGLEWAAQLAEANHHETGDWLYDDPIELAKAIRKGPDMPPVQPVADSEPDRNPVLAYADSYRDMAKQGVESVPIWSVITDLERNIAPLYRHAQPAPVAPEGYKLVPTELTSEMVKAFRSFCEAYDDDLIAGYKAMLEASQQPVPVVSDELKEAAADFLTVLDEHPEQLVPINRDSAVVRAIRAAMLAAAPQSTGSEPATAPGTWIPVSEKMPPSRHEVLVGSWWGEKSRWCCKWATYIPGHPDAQSSGWLIPGASWTPTHWMPLPAAPQEEKQ